jgi:HEAT repeat protein
MNPELTMEQCYRDHLTRVYNRLSLTALPERDPGVKDLPLDKVFVKLNVVVPAPPPSAVSFRRFSEERGEGGEFSTQRHLPRHAEGKEGVEEEWRWRQYREEIKAPPPVPISIATALRQHRHLVILGTPGSGKTTLLRWLAITFAQQQQAQPDRLGVEFSQERVPILLELRRFVSRAQHWIDSPGVFNLAKEICQWIDADARFAGITAEWMSQVLTQQPCLLLLDGLDEIADLEARRRLLESLEAFSQNPQYEKVQCLLTSRFHGFQGIALGANFQQTEVHPFSEEDIALFIRHWYATAYADMAESQAEAQQLIEAIQANVGVKELAQNPLLCTIIAIIYRNNRILPNRRVELYWKCCEALLDTWERNKAIKESGLIGGFDWQTKLELLMPVAYWFHEGNHGRLAVKEEEVVKLLTTSLEELRERRLSGGKPIEQEAREFIATIRDRSGLLQGRGDGTLEFTHRTFQEYLAARYIAKQAEAVCIDIVMTHLHEEWWREVHLLVIGHLGSGGDTAEKATRLLLTILNDAYKAPSRWLLLVGRWLPRLQWQRRLAWHILREFELVAQGYADCAPAGRTETLKNALSDFAVRRVSQGEHNRIYFAQRDFVLDILAKYALPREEVATVLVKELSDKRYVMRWGILKRLGHLGQASEEVITALVQALRDNEVLIIRQVATESLGCLGQASESVIAALVQASQDKDTLMRQAATESLGRLGQASEVVINALIQALQDKEDYVRYTAAENLGRMGQINPKIATALSKALQDAHAGVRYHAAAGLGLLRQAGPKTITALLEDLQNADFLVRYIAVQSLRDLEQANPEVITALVRLLQDENWGMRKTAADGLIRLGRHASGEAVTVLLKALQDKGNVPLIRKEAAESLGRLDRASEEIIAALVEALQDDEEFVCKAAADSLGRLGRTNELVKALQDDDWIVCREAAANLIRLGQVTQEVVAIQIRALRDKKLRANDRPVHKDAIENLGQLKKLDDQELWTEVLIVLQEKLHNNDWDDRGVRQAAFNSLRQLLEGKQIPGYRWRSLEERARFWQRFTSPLFEKLVLITLIGILLWLLGTDNQIVQILGIVGIAFTILPTLLFPPKP